MTEEEAKKPMDYAEQQAILKDVLSREPECEFDETQPDYESYLCPVCSVIMKNPVIHCCCGNSFCSDCIKSVSSCPLCRKETTEKDYAPAPKLITNKIKSFKVVCKLCRETMTYEAFTGSHKKNCSFLCPFGCGETVSRSTFEKHCKDGKCKNYLLSCPASESPLSCKWHGHGGAEYEEHISKCILVPLIPFAMYMQNSIRTIHSRICERQHHSFAADGDRTVFKCKYCGYERPLSCFCINFEAVQRTRSVTSEISTGDSTSHDGGAIYDPIRRIILSVSGNYNNGRNLKITRMTDETHGGTTLMTGIIPYGTHGQYPVYDGHKYTYFFQSEDGGNNRLGRVDMETMTFEALTSLPSSSYAEFCRPCFQNDRIYALDGDYHVREYNVQSNSWRTTQITAPSKGYLLADPADLNCIYCLCNDSRGLFRIDLAKESISHVCDTPSSFGLGANGEAVLVRVTPSEFLIFAYLSGGWHVYSSESKRWAPIPNWRGTKNGSGHFLICPEGPRAFYHVDGSDKWDTVNLRDE